MQEAQTSQQRGERKQVNEAIEHYKRAVSKYEEAIALGLSSALQIDAMFGLAESWQNWAEQALEVERRLPDNEQSAAVALEASNTALHLLEQAVLSYRGILSLGGGVWTRADGAVNCANTLTSLAELQPAVAQVETLQEAVSCYRAALTIEEDAVVRFPPSVSCSE